jgi:hypothetical protein
MFKKKKNEYGPEANMILEASNSSFEADTSNIIEDFNKGYIRKSEADYEVRKAIRETRIEDITYITLFVVMPLIGIIVATV